MPTSRVLPASTIGETLRESSSGDARGGLTRLFAKPDHQAKIQVPDPAVPTGSVLEVTCGADPDSGFGIVTAGQTGSMSGTGAAAPPRAGIVPGFVFVPPALRCANWLPFVIALVMDRIAMI